MSTDLVLHEATLSDDMDFARMVVAQPDRGAQSILPDSYKGNPANVLIAVGLGASMGLSRAESLYRIAVIKGKPTAAAELIASNVRKAGHRLRITDGDATTTATIVRADDPDFEFSITRDLKWAQTMGLASNDNYKKQLLTMLQWRAITAVARIACPEALYGVVYTPDELSDDGPAETKAPAKRGGMAGLRDAVAEPVEYVVEKTPQTDDGGGSQVETSVTEGRAGSIPAGNTPPSSEPEGDHTKAQLTKIHVLLGEQGMGERDAGLACLSDILDRPVASSKSLSKAEAHKVIEALNVPLETGRAAATEAPEQDWS